MKCGLYDESYKIAADTNLLVNYLYNCHLKVAYLPEFVTRMRIGGMSTDSAKYNPQNEMLPFHKTKCSETQNEASSL